MTVSLLAFSDILKNAGSIIAAIAVLLVMVTIHEFGHYLAGKALGFKIEEFSVGFGPAIFKKRSKKTGELFALRVIPLGGYCAFDGEDDTEEEQTERPQENGGGMGEENGVFAEFSETEEQKTAGAEVSVKTEAEDNADGLNNAGAKFNDQPPWKRIIVLLAGATMNYLLGLFLIFVMFLSCGRPMYAVVKDAPKEENSAEISLFSEETGAGLQEGDVILRIEGKKVYLITDYLSALKGKNAGDNAAITVLREVGGERKETVVNVTLAVSSTEFDAMTKTGYMVRALGVYALRPVTEQEGVLQAAGDSIAYSLKQAGMVLSSLGQLLTGKIGLDSMGGPVTTITVTAQQVQSGWQSFLNIASFIGVNLAVFNLLPIPALDGSKVVFCVIEWIRKKPINRKAEAAIHFAGIVFLFGFAILVDVLQAIL